MFSELHKMLVYNCQFQAYIQEVNLTLKFPCELFVEWKSQSGRRMVSTINRVRAKNGVATFNESIYLDAEMILDGHSQRFLKKESLIILNLISSSKADQPKMVGRLSIDLADVISNPSYFNVERYKLSYCSAEAYIAVSIKCINKKMLDKDPREFDTDSLSDYYSYHSVKDKSLASSKYNPIEEQKHFVKSSLTRQKDYGKVEANNTPLKTQPFSFHNGQQGMQWGMYKKEENKMMDISPINMIKDEYSSNYKQSDQTPISYPSPISDLSIKNQNKVQPINQQLNNVETDNIKREHNLEMLALQNQIDKVKSNMNQMELENNRLKIQLERANLGKNKQSNEKNKLIELNQIKDQLENQLIEVKAKLAEQNNKINLLESQIQKLVINHQQQLKNKLNEHQKQNQILKNRYSKQLKDEQQKRALAQSQIDRIRQEVDESVRSLKIDKDKLLRQLKRQSSKNQLNQIQINQLKSQNINLAQQLSKKSAINKKQLNNQIKIRKQVEKQLQIEKNNILLLSAQIQKLNTQKIDQKQFYQLKKNLQKVNQELLQQNIKKKKIQQKNIEIQSQYHDKIISLESQLQATKKHLYSQLTQIMQTKKQVEIQLNNHKNALLTNKEIYDELVLQLENQIDKRGKLQKELLDNKSNRNEDNPPIIINRQNPINIKIQQQLRQQIQKRQCLQRQLQNYRQSFQRQGSGSLQQQKLLIKIQQLNQIISQKDNIIYKNNIEIQKLNQLTQSKKSKQNDDKFTQLLVYVDKLKSDIALKEQQLQGFIYMVNRIEKQNQEYLNELISLEENLQKLKKVQNKQQRTIKEESLSLSLSLVKSKISKSKQSLLLLKQDRNKQSFILKQSNLYQQKYHIKQINQTKNQQDNQQKVKKLQIQLKQQMNINFQLQNKLIIANQEIQFGQVQKSNLKYAIENLRNQLVDVDQYQKLKVSLNYKNEQIQGYINIVKNLQKNNADYILQLNQLKQFLKDLQITQFKSIQQMKDSINKKQGIIQNKLNQSMKQSMKISQQLKQILPAFQKVFNMSESDGPKQSIIVSSSGGLPIQTSNNNNQQLIKQLQKQCKSKQIEIQKLKLSNLQKQQQIIILKDEKNKIMNQNLNNNMIIQQLQHQLNVANKEKDLINMKLVSYQGNTVQLSEQVNLIQEQKRLAQQVYLAQKNQCNSILEENKRLKQNLQIKTNQLEQIQKKKFILQQNNKNKIKDFQFVISQLQQQIKNLKQENKQLKQNIYKYETIKSQYIVQINNLKNHYITINEQQLLATKNLQNEINIIKPLYGDLNANYQIIKIKNQEQNNQIILLKNKNILLENHIKQIIEKKTLTQQAKKQKQIPLINTHQPNMQNQINNLNKTIEVLTNQINKVKKQLQQSLLTSINKQTQKQELLKDRNNLIAERDYIINELNKNKQQFQDLYKQNQKYSQNQKLCNDLIQKNKSQIQELLKYKNKVNNLLNFTQQEKNNLQKDYQILQNQYRMIVTQNDNIKIKIQNFQTSLINQKNNFINKQKQIKQLQSINSKLLKQIESNKQLLQKLQVSQKSSKLKEQVQYLYWQIGDLNTKLQQQIFKVQSLEEKIVKYIEKQAKTKGNLYILQEQSKKIFQLMQVKQQNEELFQQQLSEKQTQIQILKNNQIIYQQKIQEGIKINNELAVEKQLVEEKNIFLENEIKNKNLHILKLQSQIKLKQQTIQYYARKINQLNDLQKNINQQKQLSTSYVMNLENHYKAQKTKIQQILMESFKIKEEILLKKIKQLQIMCQNFQKSLKLKNQQYIKIKQQLSTLQLQYQSQQFTSSQNEQQMLNLKIQLRNKNQQIQKLSKLDIEQQKHITFIQKQSQQLKKQIKRLQQYNNDYAQKLSQYQAQSNQDKNKLNQLNAQLNNFMQKINDLQSQSLQICKVNETLQKQFVSLQKKQKQLQQQNSILIENKKKLQHKLIQFTQQKQNNQQSNFFNQLLKQKEQLTLKLSNELIEAKLQLEGAQVQVQRLQQELFLMNSQNNERQALIDSLKNQNESLKQLCDKLKEQIFYYQDTIKYQEEIQKKKQGAIYISSYPISKQEFDKQIYRNTAYLSSPGQQALLNQQQDQKRNLQMRLTQMSYQLSLAQAKIKQYSKKSLNEQKFSIVNSISINTVDNIYRNILEILKKRSQNKQIQSVLQRLVHQKQIIQQKSEYYNMQKGLIQQKARTVSMQLQKLKLLIIKMKIQKQQRTNMINIVKPCQLSVEEIVRLAETLSNIAQNQ